MTIENQPTSDGCLHLAISGRIDTETSPKLREALGSIPSDIPGLVLDFDRVEYISSSGLREILICRKRFKDDRMEIINVSPAVYNVFETTGFDTLVPLKRKTDTPSQYLRRSVKEFLKYKTEVTPDKTAVVAHGVEYTWSDIYMGSLIIAADLAAMGVKRGDHVALCGVNSINWIMTFYAIQHLGAISMLINPTQVANEIGRTAATGEAVYLCLGEMVEMRDRESFIDTICDMCGADPAHVYYIDQSMDMCDRIHEHEHAPSVTDPDVEADDPAVMIFTSGSTGRPKGVLLSSYNILNAGYNNSKDQTLVADDRNCLILPLFHVFGLVAGLVANGMADSVIYIPDNIRTDTILELIESARCTIFHSVPTMLIALINNKGFDPARLSSLRCTIISGAAATDSQIRMFKQAMPNNHFLSSYGLSEMAPVSITAYDDSEDHVLHSVGKPVENIDICILDPQGEPCETGVSGEICVQGYNMMAGYFKVPLDDQPIDENGWLHTGDLGYMDADGYLHLSGRLKELIIRGGENIMPIQVETAISESEMIENVKVVGVPSEFFGEEVAAAVIIKPGYVFDEAEFRESLKEHLARFKIPAYFVVFESFPMLGSGKINVPALKEDVIRRITAG